MMPYTESTFHIRFYWTE